MSEGHNILNMIELVGLICWPILVVALFLFMFSQSKTQDQKVLDNYSIVIENQGRLIDNTKLLIQNNELIKTIVERLESEKKPGTNH